MIRKGLICFIDCVLQEQGLCQVPESAGQCVPGILDVAFVVDILIAITFARCQMGLHVDVKFEEVGRRVQNLVFAEEQSC